MKTKAKDVAEFLLKNPHLWGRGEYVRENGQMCFIGAWGHLEQTDRKDIKIHLAKVASHLFGFIILYNDDSGTIEKACEKILKLVGDRA